MTLFYFDIDSYFCSIMAEINSALKKRPFIISHKSATARVLSASPMAKKEGVHRGDSLSVSCKKLPGIQIVPPDFALFERAGHLIMQTLSHYSPRIEPRGNGRFVLDMRGMRALYPCYADTARKIQSDIQRATRLYGQFGIAENKMVGAIAARESQIQSEELTIVPVGSEARFLAPLPCRALPEWRYQRIREHLRDLNLSQVCHIQNIPRPIFCLAIGPFAAGLHEHAFGVDLLPVTPPDTSETLTGSHLFTPPTNRENILRAELFHMVECLGFKLRKRLLGADELRMFIRFRDGLNRRKSLKITFCQNDLELYKSAKRCFTSLYNRRQAISQISISLRGLAPFHKQLELFPSKNSRHDSLQTGLDAIRQRFGPSIIRYAIPC